MLCSFECKSLYKKSLPKKLSYITTEYWMNTGLTESEANDKVSFYQKLRSPRCIEYWIKQGFSENEAQQKIKDYQSKNGKQNSIKHSREDRLKKTVFSVEYWIEKGFSLEEAQQIKSENSSTISIDAYIKRHGEEIGTRRYNEMCLNRKENYTLNGFIQKHGEEKGTELWLRKFDSRKYDSNSSFNFFNELSTLLPDLTGIYFKGHTDKEFGINSESGYYFYDFVSLNKKIIIEYNGDYWHANPNMYSSEETSSRWNGKTAGDIWKIDSEKEYVANSNGFEVVVIWESEIIEDKSRILNKCLDKLI